MLSDVSLSALICLYNPTSNRLHNVIHIFTLTQLLILSTIPPYHEQPNSKLQPQRCRTNQR